MIPRGEVIRRASFSRDQRYRYRLDRRWSDGGVLVWVMLNPSMADAHTDDATIRRCIGFANDWGFGAITVVNLFAWRATKPRDLWVALDPVGPRTDLILRQAVAESHAVIAAWGNVPSSRTPRAETVLAALPDSTMTLGVTSSGHPRHPLYLPAGTEPVPLIGREPVAHGRW
ncbi:MAG: DUF1643 domain-containing protein [Chloroflexi bacterium]|nr:DUF1643 domain-containing protein [Chloroflexota bacterium]